jgi:ferrous-iron efflux pump FieF
VGLSLMTLISVKWSAKPADDNHRHGHGKVEGIAALLQASMLLGGGAFLVLEAMGRFLHPVAMTEHLFTLFLMAISVALSLLIAKVQKLGAAHSNSLAVEADSLHYSSDVLINGAVFLIILVDYMGFVGNWLDPVCAIGVAGIMARAAYQIATKAFGMLLDEELPEDVRHRIIAKIKSHPEVLGLHDLRTTQSGMRQFMSFDIEVDANLLLWSAHEIARSIEDNLLLDFPNAEIMIHIDPAGDTSDSRHRHGQVRNGTHD